MASQPIRCELCGKETATPVRCLVEGTELKVCESCARFGKALGRAQTPRETEKRLSVLQKKPVVEASEPILLIAPDYASNIRRGRERMGLTQKEFALRISERESLLHQIESGHFKPSIELARKLEKALHITLVQEIKDSAAEQGPGSTSRASNTFILGDFIKTKAKK